MLSCVFKTFNVEARRNCNSYDSFHTLIAIGISKSYR